MIHKKAAIEALKVGLENDGVKSNRNFEDSLLAAPAFSMETKDMSAVIAEMSRSGDKATLQFEYELPFSDIYVEVNESDENDIVTRVGMFMCGGWGETNDPALYCTIELKENPTLKFIGYGTVHCGKVLVNLSDKLAETAPIEAHQAAKEMVEHFFTGALIVMYKLSDSGDVVTAKRPLTVERKVKTMKRKHRDYRLVDHKVLRIDLDRLKPDSTPLGGTHASPRLHLRRGHWRTFKNGVRTWIRPMWVGDKDLGVVHKDYEIRRDDS